MRGIDLIRKVFELKNYHSGSNDSKQRVADQVSEQKMKFSDMLQSSPPGVRDLIMNLGDDCKKAVVRGSTRRDVENPAREVFRKRKKCF
jgi:hypothetical protein